MTENELSQRDRIIREGRDLVLRYGIRSMSMADLATHLGMSKKTIYQYFKDKNDLVDAIVTVMLDHNCEMCRLERIQSKDAIHEIFLSMDMNRGIMQTMNPGLLYDLQKYHPKSFEKFRKFKDEFLFDIVKSNVLRGIEEGLYRTDFHVELIARFRTEAVNFLFNREVSQQLKLSMELVFDELHYHFMYGLVTPKGYKLIQKYQQQLEDQKQKK